jgi:putative ABC transport system permease protein
MAALREWIVRLWQTLRSRRADGDLEEELRSHLAMAGEDARRRGDSPEAARARRIEAGAVAQALESLRDQRGLPWLRDLARDLRYGGRMLRRNPGFACIAVMSLAIGIGANCAVFSFADALLLRPLSVPRPSEIVTVGSTTSLDQSLSASYRDYVDVRDRSTSFEGLVASTESSVAFATQPRTAPRPRIGILVSSNFFPVMGVTPELGRAFRADEDQVPGRDAVVVLGHDLWTLEFGADRAILGRTVRLNGIDFTVIGVAPASVAVLDRFTRYEFYAPLMMWSRLRADPTIRPFEARDFRNLEVKGRLKNGVTIAQAQTELSVIARDLARAYPETNRDQRIVVRTELQERFAESPANVLLVAMLGLLAAAVLFVACANVAGLLASRAPMRAREIALRLAAGAGRARVIRQLITESLLIAVLGGVLGLGVGYAGVTLFRQFRIPTELPIAVPFELDRRALTANLVVALISAVLFGLAPALRATRGDLTAVMKATDTAGFGRRRRWGHAILVGGQVAVAVVVLAVATFVYRDFQRRLETGPGFKTDHRLMMVFNPSLVQYSEAQAQQFFDQVAERARLTPGVTSATLTSFVPMDGGARPVTVVPEGYQFPAGSDRATVYSATVDDRYFETLGQPILQGRGFRATDSARSPGVAVVNEQFARHYWPGQNPLGKRFRLTDRSGSWVEVVGICPTTRYFFLIESPAEFVYFPYRQHPQPRMALVAESAGDPSNLAAPLREAIGRLDANQPIYNVRTLDEMYRMRVVTILNVVVSLVGAMGLMGLTLAIVGLYGLVAYAVSRRTKEIGIRMAIGAGRSDVLRMVLRQGIVLALSGLAAGLLVSLGANRALGIVFPAGAGGNDRIDFVAFALVGSVVLAVTLFAAYMPARRASRINPTDALRCE